MNTIGFFTPEQLKQACRYGNAIRNKAKREYCWKYLAYLRNGAMGLEPEHPGLGYMGAQAVRDHLYGILRDSEAA